MREGRSRASSGGERGGPVTDRAVILTRELTVKAPVRGNGLPDKLLGISFLKRAVLTALQGGIRKVAVLHGPESAENVALLVRDDQLKGIAGTLLPMPVDRSQALPGVLGEGTGGILLLSEETVFDPQLMGVLADGGASPGRCNGRAGLALCPESILPAFIEAVRQGGPLPDLLERSGWAPGRSEDRDRLSEEPFSVSVRSREDYKEAEKRLLRSVRKKTDGFVSRHLNRPVSLFLSRLFIRLGISPNQISLGNLGLGLLGAWLTALGGDANILAGALLFQVSSILDGSDGEVAKLTFRSSERGSWIDTLCDELTCLAYFAALPVGLYRTHHDVLYLYLGVTTLLSGGLLYFLMISYVRNSGKGGSMLQLLDEFERVSLEPGALGRISRVVSTLSFVVRRDFFSFAIFVLCLLGMAHVIVWTIGLMTPAAAIYMAWLSVRQREPGNARREGATESAKGKGGFPS